MYRFDLRRIAMRSPFTTVFAMQSGNFCASSADEAALEVLRRRGGDPTKSLSGKGCALLSKHRARRPSMLLQRALVIPQGVGVYRLRGLADVNFRIPANKSQFLWRCGSLTTPRSTGDLRYQALTCGQRINELLRQRTIWLCLVSYQSFIFSRATTADTDVSAPQVDGHIRRLPIGTSIQYSSLDASRRSSFESVRVAAANRQRSHVTNRRRSTTRRGPHRAVT